jgi:hypothetical protein
MSFLRRRKPGDRAGACRRGEPDREALAERFFEDYARSRICSRLVNTNKRLLGSQAYPGLTCRIGTRFQDERALCAAASAVDALSRPLLHPEEPINHAAHDASSARLMCIALGAKDRCPGFKAAISLLSRSPDNYSYPRLRDKRHELHFTSLNALPDRPVVPVR